MRKVACICKTVSSKWPVCVLCFLLMILSVLSHVPPSVPGCIETEDPFAEWPQISGPTLFVCIFGIPTLTSAATDLKCTMSHPPLCYIFWILSREFLLKVDKHIPEGKLQNIYIYWLSHFSLRNSSSNKHPQPTKYMPSVLVPSTVVTNKGSLGQENKCWNSSVSYRPRLHYLLIWIGWGVTRAMIKELSEEKYKTVVTSKVRHASLFSLSFMRFFFTFICHFSYWPSHLIATLFTRHVLWHSNKIPGHTRPHTVLHNASQSNTTTRHIHQQWNQAYTSWFSATLYEVGR